MGVTIKYIAKLANVSHTTVSRALNDSPLVNEETKNKIKAIAKELHYVPDVSARSLVTRKSFNIGLFFSTMGEETTPEFFYQTIMGVNSVIKGNYNLVVKSIDDYNDFSFIDKKNFDGIIVMSQSDNDDNFIDYAHKKKIPVVVLNRHITDNSIVNVLSADMEGAYIATKYLIENGHKNIAFIEGKLGFRASKERKKGFIKALEKYNIKICKEYLVRGNYTMESGYKAMKKLLDIKDRPTAVFCSNDDMAVGAMKASFEAGFTIPDDISIIGFDNSSFCRFTIPALTTVKRDISGVSKKGAEILLSGKDCKNKKIYIDTELIVRESVKKIR